MKKYILLINAILFACVSIHAAEFLPYWKFHFAYGSNVTLAKVDNKVSASAYSTSRVYIEPGFSSAWPMGRKTGLKFYENLFHNGQWSFLAERFKGRRSFTTGLELGGRYFKVTEYEHYFSGDKFTEAFANQARRNYCVASVPFIWKLYWGSRVKLAAQAGIVLNYESSVKRKTLFYSSERENSLYPTIHVGGQISFKKYRNFTLDLAYQQGFYNILKDQVTVQYAGVYKPYQTTTYNVQSNGSHFRVALRYTLPMAIGKALPYNQRSFTKEIVLVQESDTIQICFSDKMQEDGDSIVIVLNGKPVVEPVEVRKEEQCVTIHLDSSRTKNEIVIHAVNLGRIKPNTYSFRYSTGSTETADQEVKTDLKNSVKITIRKPKAPKKRKQRADEVEY